MARGQGVVEQLLSRVHLGQQHAAAEAALQVQGVPLVYLACSSPSGLLFVAHDLATVYWALCSPPCGASVGGRQKTGEVVVI